MRIGYYVVTWYDIHIEERSHYKVGLTRAMARPTSQGMMFNVSLIRLNARYVCPQMSFTTPGQSPFP